MTEDPHQFINLVMNAEYATILQELRGQIDKRMREVRDIGLTE